MFLQCLRFWITKLQDNMISVKCEIVYKFVECTNKSNTCKLNFEQEAQLGLNSVYGHQWLLSLFLQIWMNLMMRPISTVQNNFILSALFTWRSFILGHNNNLTLLFPELPDIYRAWPGLHLSVTWTVSKPDTSVYTGPYKILPVIYTR